MRAGLRDLRLVPAAVGAWLVAGVLAGVPGADAAAGLVASASWGLAGLAIASAIWLTVRHGVNGSAQTPGARVAGGAGGRGRGLLPAATIAAVATAWPATTIAVGGGAAPFEAMPDWAMAAEPLRERFRELVVDMPGDGGELLPGLSIGDDRMVGPVLLEAMRITSLTHLTAVSGANCALVVGMVMIGGALIGIPRWLRIVLALLALGAFVVLVAPQPSVVRAAVMAAIALVGLAAARPMQGLPLLCIAIAGILGAVPSVAIEIGFVLSALATTGLLVLSGPLGALAGSILPARIATALAVPAAAQLAVQPAIALIQPELPTYGVIANLLAVPAAPVATVVGMLACLIAPIAPPLALGIAWLGWLPSQWIASVATTFAAFPASRLPWPEGPVGVLLHALVLLVVSIALLARGARRTGAVLLVLAIGAGYAGSLAGAKTAAVASRPADWAIAMCDVGQGDAALVRSRGIVALVDTGPDRHALADCLRELDIEWIDLLVLTHFDRDHVGGTDAVLGRVGTVLTGPADPISSATVLGALESAGAQISHGRTGDHGTLGDAPWRVLWPPAHGTPPPGNDSSLVWRIDPAPGVEVPSAVFLGDLGAVAQARLLGRGVGGPAAVVKASHHGSADQHPQLYEALAPRIGLVGVGRDNDYGHPTESLLAVLRGVGAVVGRTDTDGLLLVVPPGEDLQLWRARAPDVVTRAD